MVRKRELLGCFTALILLWFITIARVIVDFRSHDNTTVFIYEGCIAWGTISVFIACLMEVVLGAWFLKKYFLPLLFGERWDSFDTLKQQKLVGFLAQIVIRAACFVQLLSVVLSGPHLSFQGGLFPEFNAKAAYAELVETNVPTSCAVAGMQEADVGAMRAFYFSRYHMAAVHIWELSFIPGLPLDAWLHHLFVIVCAAIGVAPDLFPSNAPRQPFFDAIAFNLVMGASLNFAVKFCVVMYHYTAPDGLRQAKWMEYSIAGAWLIVVIFYTAIPLVIAIIHAKDFGAVFLVFAVLLPIAFLDFIEIRLINVKRSIAKNARRKAARSCNGDEELEGTSMVRQTRNPSFVLESVLSPVLTLEEFLDEDLAASFC